MDTTTFSLRITENTLSQLKWLKNRYGAIHGMDMDWEEFLRKVMDDATFMLAVEAIKKYPEFELDQILTMLKTGLMAVDEAITESIKTRFIEANKIIPTAIRGYIHK